MKDWYNKHKDTIKRELHDATLYGVGVLVGAGVSVFVSVAVDRKRDDLLAQRLDDEDGKIVFNFQDRVLQVSDVTEPAKAGMMAAIEDVD